MIMTKEQQDKLRRALYNAKFTTDAEDENPFVGIYFNDLLDIIHDFGQQHPNWIPVERELPKETGWYLVVTPTLNSKIDVALWDGKWHRLITITNWMPIVPPRKE